MTYVLLYSKSGTLNRVLYIKYIALAIDLCLGLAIASCLGPEASSKEGQGSVEGVFGHGKALL